MSSVVRRPSKVESRKSKRFFHQSQTEASIHILLVPFWKFVFVPLCLPPWLVNLRCSNRGKLMGLLRCGDDGEYGSHPATPCGCAAAQNDKDHLSHTTHPPPPPQTLPETTDKHNRRPLRCVHAATHAPLIAAAIAANVAAILLLPLKRDRTQVQHIDKTLAIAAPAGVLLALLLAAYAQAALVNPGTPSESWIASQRQKPDGDVRTCRRSMLPKPPRAHYCSVTHRLVLNMDHYCPWVANTIGFYNRRFFLQLLLYSVLFLVYALAAISAQAPALARWVHSSRLPTSLPPGLVLAIVGVALGVDALLLCSLAPFCTWHWKMALRNQTTIDGSRFPQYDLGARANLEQIFGARPSLWLLPVPCGGPLGDGIEWPTRECAPGDAAAGATPDTRHPPWLSIEAQEVRGGASVAVEEIV